MKINKRINLAQADLMPRHLTVLQSDFPYNISARCINKEWFNLPMKHVWKIFCDELCNTVEKQKIEIHSFVLMSNHFHLIVSTPQANISQGMQYFMQRTSRRLTLAGNRINESFAGRHYKCILQSPNYYLNAYKYNYRNPVTAGLCNKVEDYPFSTLKCLVYKTPALIPILEDATFNSDPEGILNWLNQRPDDLKMEAARFGFKRQYFKSKRCRNTGKLIMDENDIL